MLLQIFQALLLVVQFYGAFGQNSHQLSESAPQFSRPVGGQFQSANPHGSSASLDPRQFQTGPQQFHGTPQGPPPSQFRLHRSQFQSELPQSPHAAIPQQTPEGPPFHGNQGHAAPPRRITIYQYPPRDLTGGRGRPLPPHLLAPMSFPALQDIMTVPQRTHQGLQSLNPSVPQTQHEFHPHHPHTQFQPQSQQHPSHFQHPHAFQQGLHVQPQPSTFQSHSPQDFSSHAFPSQFSAHQPQPSFRHGPSHFSPLTPHHQQLPHQFHPLMAHMSGPHGPLSHGPDPHGPHTRPSLHGPSDFRTHEVPHGTSDERLSLPAQHDGLSRRPPGAEGGRFAHENEEDLPFHKDFGFPYYVDDSNYYYRVPMSKAKELSSRPERPANLHRASPQRDAEDTEHPRKTKLQLSQQKKSS